LIALVSALNEALDAVPPDLDRLAVAVSGGPDSSALAMLAASAARDRGWALHVFHVHHGLHPQADDWAQVASCLAGRLGLPFEQTRVTVDASDGRGIEAAARVARYAALGDMARAAGVRHILLGHHQDDQVETVMLRLLRGAGLDGVGGMAAESRLDGIDYLRPWLTVPRSRIVEYLREYGPALAPDYVPVTDPSNLDARYARGALRGEVLPAIERTWPGYRSTLERFARLATESAQVLREVALADLETVQEHVPPYDHCVRVSALLELSEARQTLVLRLWLAEHGLTMPSEARLLELQRQLQRAARDRQIVLQHEAVHVRRFRDWLVIDRAGDRSTDDGTASADAAGIVWAGEADIRVESHGGTLQFLSAAQGIDPQWLRGGPLSLGWRRGRERLKVGPSTPSRSLKNLYQERGIPSWERERLPLVYRGDILVYAAGLGIDARVPQAAPGIRLNWVADRPGATVVS
jgi:tRNA(Ile)-lysidine synthase